MSEDRDDGWRSPVEPLKVGDMVQFVSGGPVMRIEEIGSASMELSCVVEGEVRRVSALPETLLVRAVWPHTSA